MLLLDHLGLLGLREISRRAMRPLAHRHLAHLGQVQALANFLPTAEGLVR